MMTNEQKEVNCRIAKYYGTEQIGVCIEECAELIQALCKYKRLSSGQPPRKTRAEIIRNITEEIADVTIMIEQVKELLHIKEPVESWIIYKLNRTLDSMEE